MKREAEGTAVALRFLAGRYHATPWGSHVNEAALEWPPAPWRLLRGLVAVWHLKVSPDEINEAELEGLIETLAASDPAFFLPAATHAHTRHYMPIRAGKSEKKTLVFDAFACVDRSDELVILWPVSLSPESHAQLELLFRRLGYLGRAESWVEARLLGKGWTGAVNCTPVHLPQEQLDTWQGGELVSLPTALAPGRYRAWRTEQVKELGLDGSRLSAKKQRLLATLPERQIDAMRLDTGRVRARGWSRHPGMTYSDYLRPADAIGVRDAKVRAAPASADVTVVRLMLVGRPLPRIEDAIRVGEVVRRAAMSRSAWVAGDDEMIPPVLSGHSPDGESDHQHAFYLPEDADEDGRIDHVLVTAEQGFDELAMKTWASLRRIWLDDGHEWRVILDLYGTSQEFAHHRYLRPAKQWLSLTPYLHPWFRKRKFGVEDQILRECRVRGLPEPDLARRESVTVHGRERRPVDFHRFRRRGGRRRAQPDTRGSFWELRFPEPVPGPIALGFGCHYGLGIFRAEDG